MVVYVWLQVPNLFYNPAEASCIVCRYLGVSVNDMGPRNEAYGNKYEAANTRAILSHSPTDYIWELDLFNIWLEWPQIYTPAMLTGVRVKDLLGPQHINPHQTHVYPCINCKLPRDSQNHVVNCLFTWLMSSGLQSMLRITPFTPTTPAHTWQLLTFHQLLLLSPPSPFWCCLYKAYGRKCCFSTFKMILSLYMAVAVFFCRVWCLISESLVSQWFILNI